MTIRTARARLSHTRFFSHRRHHRLKSVNSCGRHLGENGEECMVNFRNQTEEIREPLAWTPVSNKSQLRSAFQLPPAVSPGVNITAHMSPLKQRRFWCIIKGEKKGKKGKKKSIKQHSTCQACNFIKCCNLQQFAAVAVDPFAWLCSCSGVQGC